MAAAGRELIARHFNERLRLRERGDGGDGEGKTDVTAEAVGVLQILEQLVRIDKPTTLLQVNEPTGKSAS